MGKIVGSVYWIEKGKPTTKVVTAAQAFGDPAQAEQQVLYFDRQGSATEKKLARLGYRQFQGKRYRTATSQ